MCNEGFDILIEFYLEYVQRMNNIATFRKSFCAFVQRRIFFFFPATKLGPCFSLYDLLGEYLVSWTVMFT